MGITVVKTKYAIKVCLGGMDWLYVTEDAPYTMFELQPMLFNTRQEAEEHAKIWNKSKVVRYRKEQQ